MPATQVKVPITLAQVNPTVGDIQGNLERCRRVLGRVSADTEVIVFPECALPGYPAEDLLLEESFLTRLDEALRSLAGEIKRPWVILGTVRREAGQLFNTAAVLHGGQIVTYRDKALLPTYDVFDEARYFTPASTIEPVNLTLSTGQRLRVGLQICEDLWDRGYDLQVCDRLGEAGIDLFINISASPFRDGIFEERLELIKEKVARWSKPFLYCNLVGGQDELVFDGRSLATDSSGQLVASGAGFEEDVLTLPMIIDSEGYADLPREGAAALKSLSREEELHSAIVLGIHDYFYKTGHTQAVVGLSGGIDSSLVAALAARALGPDQVTGIAMPTRYSSDDSEEDARQLAHNLGINFQTLPIEALRLDFLQILEPYFGGSQPGTAEENLQARIRGTLLMAVANKQGGLLLATGNKTELALGYATLYGDMSGGLAPIGDLSKSDVYALSHHLNAAGSNPVIPQRVLEKTPTAELRENQVDPFDYDIVSPLIDDVVVRRASAAALLQKGYDAALIREVRDLMVKAEHKRRQAAPIIRVTDKAFGVGWRYPIVNRYDPRRPEEGD